MAQSHEIKLNVDTGNSVDELNKLENVLSDIGDELVPLTTQMGDMEDKLMLMAYAGDKSSDEFKKLSEQVAGMRRSIRETDAGLEALSMTTSQKLSGALGGVTSGFEAFQGGMAAFGVESENVEKALLQVQSAMALSQGVQGIKEALPAVKALGSGAISTFKAMTTAGKAFALTGIGLVITGLTAAASALDFFGDSTDDAAKEQEKLDAALQSTNYQLSEMERNSQSVGKMQKYNTDLAVIEAKKRGASEQELNKIYEEAAKERLETLKRERDKQSEYYLEISKTGSNEQFAAVEEAYRASRDRVRDAELEYKNIIAENELDNIAKRKEAEAKRKEETNRWLEEQKNILEQIKRANYDYLNTKKSQEEQEVISSRDKWDALIKDAKKYKLDTKQLLINKEDEEKAIRKKYADEQVKAEQEKQDAINKVIKDAQNQQLEDKEAFDQLYREATVGSQQLELDAVGEKYNYLVEMAKQYGYDTYQLEQDRLKLEQEINEKYSKEAEDKEITRTQRLKDLRIQAIQDTLSTISNLSEIFAGKSEKSQKRAFDVQKAVSIAQATIDTYKAANAALGSAPPPFNYIAMVATITAGILNIKKIAQTKFEGGTSSGGGGTSVPSSAGGGVSNVMTPQFNIVGNNPMNQLAQLTGQPIQAYVVSGQITTAQSLDRNKIENATL